jgi:cytosine/adenosine deaminase-related metal-dependent hydrolase
MLSWPRRATTFVNGRVLGPEGRLRETLRVRGCRIEGLDVAPARRDRVVDLRGAWVLPGLVNAHDHLELNSFPRLKWRERYRNVREWIADFQPRFASDPALAAARPETLADRLWVGGLKNLLSGVTTVCHHNPYHAPLAARFPVRVVRRYGFSHSLQVDGARIADAYRRTPPGSPWLVHAAEGIDAEAAGELDALARLECLGPNTVLVHGVGLDAVSRARALAGGAALVWCPSSNEFLFGATADVRAFDDAGRLALGSDSRLSGAGDLLDELRAAHASRQLCGPGLLRAVTSGAAAVLRLRGAGTLAPGAPADLVVLRPLGRDPLDSLLQARRGDVLLTMIDGRPLVGEPWLAGAFAAAGVRTRRATLDGAPRLVAEWIGRRAASLALAEPGLEIAA